MFQFTHPGGVRRLLVHFVRCLLLSFNSRTREGCDYRFNPFRLLAYQFQFTHPGGVRPQPYVDLDVQISGFNSRTREGCDGSTMPLPLVSGEFQFTHPGGVRPPSVGSCRLDESVSIHAPGRGATS